MAIKLKSLLGKGSRHEIFEFRFFSWISFPHAPEYRGGHFEFLRKFAEILESKGVNDSGEKWKSFWDRSFFIFCWDAVGLLFNDFDTVDKH